MSMPRQIAAVLRRQGAPQAVALLSHGPIYGAQWENLLGRSTAGAETRRALMRVGAVCREMDGHEALWSLAHPIWGDLVRAADGVPNPAGVWTVLDQPGAIDVLQALLIGAAPPDRRDRNVRAAIRTLRTSGLVHQHRLQLERHAQTRRLLSLLHTLALARHQAEVKANLRGAMVTSDARESLLGHRNVMFAHHGQALGSSGRGADEQPVWPIDLDMEMELLEARLETMRVSDAYRDTGDAPVDLRT